MFCSYLGLCQVNVWIYVCVFAECGCAPVNMTRVLIANSFGQRCHFQVSTVDVQASTLTHTYVCIHTHTHIHVYNIFALHHFWRFLMCFDTCVHIGRATRTFSDNKCNFLLLLCVCVCCTLGGVSSSSLAARYLFATNGKLLLFSRLVSQMKCLFRGGHAGSCFRVFCRRCTM